MKYILTCSYCNIIILKTPYYIRENNYCSNQCHQNSRKNQATRACLNCGKSVTKQISQFNTNCFCSYKCANTKEHNPA